MPDPLQLLTRDDKHYLGSGNGLIFAPRFPRWLGWPGFWDEIDVHHYQLAPLFTVVFLDTGSGRPDSLSLRRLSRRWTPADLSTHYRLADGLEGWEHRSVLSDGHFLSEWKLLNGSDTPRTLLSVAWTVQDTEGLDLSTVSSSAGAVSFQRVLRDRRGQELTVEVRLAAAGGDQEGSAYLAERSTFDPHWELTPFPEVWRSGVRSLRQLGGVSSRGALYLAVVSRIELPARGAAAARLQASVEPIGMRTGEVRGAASAALAGLSPATIAPPAAEPGAASRASWKAYFDALPQLSCSDPFFERYWYYRWYGLRLCAHEGGIGNHVYPGCCEGTGYFHVPIGYSAQCHARELRWLPDPSAARGVILNFLANQKESGQLHGRLYLNHLEGTDFYFADWGSAVLAVDAVHPDIEFLRAVYGPLSRYAEWLQRERDPEGTGLIDVIDHYETGQEYMSRYMAVSAEADAETWGSLIRLKGVDATVYAYNVQRALAVIAGRLQNPDESQRWAAAAERTGRALLERMWDAEGGVFSDVDPGTGQRTGIKAAVCFYPYLTDLTGAEHLAGLKEHLLNPAEFWTEYPVPSTSVDDPYYSPDAEWKGKRHSCPWNGRVWPMANSHVAEALARVAIAHDPGLREAAVELISKFVCMMFHGGDPARPNCYEHYNPETGRPSLYRGYDDYQHSWVNDLIVQYVAGFRPADGDAFVIDPFPFGLRSLRLAGLIFRGQRVDITIEGERFSVRLNRKASGRSRIGEPLHVAP